MVDNSVDPQSLTELYQVAASGNGLDAVVAKGQRRQLDQRLGRPLEMRDQRDSLWPRRTTEARTEGLSMAPTRRERQRPPAPDAAANPGGAPRQGRQLGLLAQQVRQVLPELVAEPSQLEPRARAASTNDGSIR